MANGNNVKIAIDGNKMTITVDLTKELGASKSGKNMLIASTKGNQTLENGMVLGLNLYRPID